VVLSREEVDRVIGHLDYPYDLVAQLLYGCGLRLFECLKLRVKDLNFDIKVLTVHDGKGKKDRTVPLPEVLMPVLKSQLDKLESPPYPTIDNRTAFANVVAANSSSRKQMPPSA
jgi:integrase